MLNINTRCKGDNSVELLQYYRYDPVTTSNGEHSFFFVKIRHTSERGGIITENMDKCKMIIHYNRRESTTKRILKKCKY